MEKYEVSSVKYVKRGIWVPGRGLRRTGEGRIPPAALFQVTPRPRGGVGCPVEGC